MGFTRKRLSLEPSLKDKGKERREVVISLLLSLAILLAVTAVVQPAVVRGQSMEPTLIEGDYLLVYNLGKPHKGDIVIASHDGEYIVKRVIGEEGDKIEGKILPKGYYYLAGDNRDNSYDSRNYGAINTVRGRVICRILPNFKVFKGAL